MLKKILTLLIIFFGASVFASDNFLNSVVIDENDGIESIIFRTDNIAKIKKEINNPDLVTVTLKNVKQSQDVNTLYKGETRVDGLILQNENNDLKVYIEAPDISKANIVFETPNSAPIIVSDTSTDSKFLWSIISVLLIFLIMAFVRNFSSSEPQQKDINEIIKEREKALYKNFQKEIATLPSMNYKLKSYRKHVLKGETIRSYESRLSKI